MEKEFSSSSSSASAETIEVHDVSRAQFPPDFVFGVATSAYQVEEYQKVSTKKELTTNDLINTVIVNDMKPFVTLFHFDLPHALEEEFDGFLNRDVAGRPYHQHYPLLNAALAHHAAASNQTIFNSSISSDAKRKRDPAKDAYTVGRNLLLAHALAVHSYRTKFQEHQKGQIGIALNTLWCEPYKKGDADDIEAVKRAKDFVMGWFLEPVLTGKYPKTMIDCVPCENLAAFSDGEAEMLKGSVDFLGLNYYTGFFVANDPNPTDIGYLGDQRVEICFSDATGKKLGPEAGLFWLHVYPEGIYNVLIKYVIDKYGDKIPPIYITENGVAEKNNEKLTVTEACVDSMREDYHKTHFVYLLKAMKEKTAPANVKGYFAWSWCDNFEWAHGYTARFGLIYIDYKNNQKRYPKTSARWFAKFLGGKEFLGANQENVEE
ncbi:UNVERIFIED_CONTAM: Beta-glucosidase 11 [Sesamum calycinum]|uniref:Beta-glucosidase 11 n=1 Tax=Sesamum calycinum TaxID=2727403 RepID=A0AAW2LX29_9LAMI